MRFLTVFAFLACAASARADSILVFARPAWTLARDAPAADYAFGDGSAPERLPFPDPFPPSASGSAVAIGHARTPDAPEGATWALMLVAAAFFAALRVRRFSGLLRQRKDQSTQA
jgi:hypothetical protein